LKREIELLKEVHHPHIIELYEVYEDDSQIHMVTELCTGGELYDKVVEKAESPEGHFNEEDAGILARDILDAIRYIHDELNIVHRDLKPENFLLKDESDEAAVKIIDFGLSRKNDAPFGIMTTRVGTFKEKTWNTRAPCIVHRALETTQPFYFILIGTPYYVAPEVLTEHYTYKCDMWSIGGT